MKQLVCGLALALLAACGPETAPENESVKNITSAPATSLVVKCSTKGTSVTQDQRGQVSAATQATSYYRIDQNGTEVQIYDATSSAFKSACPADRKCDIRVHPDRIEIATQLSNPDGMTIVSRTDINRLSGDVQTADNVDWLVGDRSVRATATGTCQPSQEPTPKF